MDNKNNNADESSSSIIFNDEPSQAPDQVEQTQAPDQVEPPLEQPPPSPSAAPEASVAPPSAAAPDQVEPLLEPPPSAAQEASVAPEVSVAPEASVAPPDQVEPQLEPPPSQSAAPATLAPEPPQPPNQVKPRKSLKNSDGDDDDDDDDGDDDDVVEEEEEEEDEDEEDEEYIDEDDQEEKDDDDFVVGTDVQINNQDIQFDNLFTKNILVKEINIPFQHVGNNLHDYLEFKLKNMYENKCIEEGFIKRNSIKLIENGLSYGLLKDNDIFFNVLFECDICKPVEKQIIKCVVKNITRAGIKCVYYNESESSPIIVFIAKDVDINNNPDDIRKFSECEKGKQINIKVMGVRYELYDEFISIIASIV